MSLGRAIAVVGGFTMLSRLLGFARDMAMSRILGAGPVADAFFIAFKLPNFFRRLFAEGAFASAFVPLFAAERARSGIEEAAAFAREAQAALLAVLLPFTALAIIAMPVVVALIAPGLRSSPQTIAWAIDFGRIAFPYLVFISLVSLYGGALNGLERFGHAAATQMLLNVVLLVALFGLTPLMPNPGYALAIGVFTAGIVQWLWLLDACRRAGLSMLPRWPILSPRIRRMLTLVVPAAIGAGAFQINAMLDVVWASFMADGTISVLYYADRINQLPLGVVGIAIGTSLLPLLSRQLRDGSTEAAMANQNRAIEFGLLFSLPAAAALSVAALPIMATLFEGGKFGPAESARAAAALSAFAAGLPAFILVKALTTGFYAREDTRTPLNVALASIALNIALNVIFLWSTSLQHVGVALASSLSGWLNALLLGWLLVRRGHLVADPRLKSRAWRMLVAALVMGLVLWLALRYAGGAFATPGAMRWLALAALCLGGAALYGAVGAALGIVRLSEIRGLLRRQPGVRPEID
ncbi:MAG: murein biosynthesis integral membrane protein MurJ [Alphaproteobacteria bacterium]|nr:murein biosynthesis integral membrane protein MurJ [Alphaproteobacteria bacterium]MCW5741034.1 murein biosynthesis integral membrane protein MurJ [Alphaproteobacteria bacterium]